MNPDCNPSCVNPHPIIGRDVGEVCGCVSATPEPSCLHDRVGMLERIVNLLLRERTETSDLRRLELQCQIKELLNEIKD